MVTMQATPRRLAIGAEWMPEDDGTSFRIWAPEHTRLGLVLEDRGNVTIPLEQDSDGYFKAFVGDAAASSRYKYLVDAKGRS